MRTVVDSATWRTVKQAVRIFMDDGASLKAAGIAFGRRRSMSL